MLSLKFLGFSFLRLLITNTVMSCSFRNEEVATGAAGTQPRLSALFRNPFSVNVTASSQGGPHSERYRHRVWITSPLILTWVKPTLKSYLVSELSGGSAEAFPETPLQPNLCLILLFSFPFEERSLINFQLLTSLSEEASGEFTWGHYNTDFLL